MLLDHFLRRGFLAPDSPRQLSQRKVVKFRHDVPGNAFRISRQTG
jgi:hypothetical protein